MSRRRTTLVMVGVVVGVALVAASVSAGVALLARPEPTIAGSAEPSPSPSAPVPLTATEIYGRVLPSVVIVRTGPNGGKSGTSDAGLGTGTVISRDGTILTAAHVVGDNLSVSVEFADGTETTAEVITTDPATDIATLTPLALPQVLVPAVIGGDAGVGDRVVAIGHPLGLTATTTEGIVSGLDRSVTVRGGATLDGLIQFDAAVNPGSSGGPLLDEQGQVIGVVSALANPTDDRYFIGIGFAVPIGQALGAGLDGEGPER